MRPPFEAPRPQAPQRRGLGLSFPPTCPQTDIISTHNPNSKHFYPSSHGDQSGQRAVSTEDRPGHPRRNLSLDLAFSLTTKQSVFWTHGS